MKYTKAMKKFAYEYKKRDPKCTINITVVEYGHSETRQYVYDAVAFVGISHGSKSENEKLSVCTLEGEVLGVGGGINKRHIMRGIRSILKKVKRL